LGSPTIPDRSILYFQFSLKVYIKLRHFKQDQELDQALVPVLVGESDKESDQVLVWEVEESLVPAMVRDAVTDSVQDWESMDQVEAQELDKS